MLKQNYNSREKAMRNIISLQSIAMVVLFVGMVWALGFAFDQHFENQDRMLCSSAKQSGNVEMLKRCSTYYETGNARDIQWQK